MLAILLLFVSLVAVITTNGVHAAGTETLIGVVGRGFVMLGADTSVARSIVLTSTQVDKVKVLSDRTVMAAAGELADVDDIYATLKKHVTLSELETGVPSGVEFVNLGEDAAMPEAWTALSTSAVARLARHEIAQRLRSRTPYQGLGLFVAGMQKDVQVPGSQHTRVLKSGTTFSTQFADDVRRQLKAPSSEGGASEKEDFDNNNQLKSCLFWLDEYGSLQKVNYGIHGLGANFGLAVLDQGFRDNLSRDEAADLILNCFDQLQTRFLINSPKPPLIKCVDADGCRVYERSGSSSSLS